MDRRILVKTSSVQALVLFLAASCVSPDTASTSHLGIADSPPFEDPEEEEMRNDCIYDSCWGGDYPYYSFARRRFEDGAAKGSAHAMLLLCGFLFECCVPDHDPERAWCWYAEALRAQKRCGMESSRLKYMEERLRKPSGERIEFPVRVRHSDLWEHSFPFRFKDLERDVIALGDPVPSTVGEIPDASPDLLFAEAVRISSGFVPWLRPEADGTDGTGGEASAVADLYERAFDAGCRWAALPLSELSAWGVGTPRDETASEQWLRRSAVAGDPIGMTEWARHLMDLRSGDGCRNSPRPDFDGTVPRRTLEAAMGAGYAPAMRELALWQLFHEYSKRPVRVGFDLLREAARRGDVRAEHLKEIFLLPVPFGSEEKWVGDRTNEWEAIIHERIRDRWQVREPERPVAEEEYWEGWEDDDDPE